MLPTCTYTPDPTHLATCDSISIVLKLIKDTGESEIEFVVDLIQHKEKPYVLLREITGAIGQLEWTTHWMVEMLQRVASGWQERFGPSTDRFAVNPELYEILPNSILNFIEIDDELLFFGSKGVAHFSETVPLYQIQMV